METAGAPRSEDQRVTLRDVSWTDYEVLLTMRGEAAVPRMTYLNGELELTSPSGDHEYLKKTIARLVEAWGLHRDIDMTGLGSWTVRKAAKARGLEPDECYVFGGRDGKQRPDLAIEVGWTSGAIEKLEVYRGLAIPEVWIWRGAIEVYRLEGGEYARSARSVELPDLDLDFLASCLEEASQTAAVKRSMKGVGGA